ncbi:MAG TPA: NAD(P)-dependent oxidoreductase [Phycisphaerales bacterium]|nr:NAD(P)-dependent oxidoreductase [Phycisphaerales bacterium]
MTVAAERMLLTGGSGRLGRELQRLLPGIAAPGRDELDVTRAETVVAALDRWRPEVVIHAAAYTDVAGAERNRAACWRVNVDGTRNVVSAAAGRGIFLLHLSTDYVFEGATGGYREDDPPGPPCNYYALTKLVAEALVRFAPRHLVVRTSFRPREWPYPQAFDDLFTSQDYVDVIAPEIALAASRCLEIPYNTLHVATERKSALELARRRRPDVQSASKKQASVRLPDDISLDTARWRQLKQRWSQP